MVPMPRILTTAVALLALAAFWPEPAAAQFWAPWFSRGYHPPQQQERRGGGAYDTILPWQHPQAKPKRAPKKEAAPEAAAPPPIDDRPVPYEPEFSRLAELLGALHYLGPLCGEKKPDPWRQELEELLAAEQPSQPRKDRLVASFNRGFQSYELTYRHCTPSASLAINRSRAEGAKLAREIATRYGN
jgi:uncharacterized protein (TIGR02301 family)